LHLILNKYLISPYHNTALMKKTMVIEYKPENNSRKHT